MTIDRRRFVAVAGAAIAGTVRPLHAVRKRADHDIVIRGGAVFDGSGRPPVMADVAVSAGRIRLVEPRIAGKGAEEFDARGLAVAPGFIDIHSHGDGSLDADPRAESLIRQGVTTIVGGQDGGSRANGGDRSFADYFAELARIRPAVNVASMVGLGTIRGAVVGDDDRPATPGELARMVAMVARAVADGACGASSGLEYTPGAFASRDELIALCRPLVARDSRSPSLPYATHMRNEDDRLLDAIDESIAVARGAGCPLHISHLKTQGPRNWPRLTDAFARIETARAAGLDVTFDRYPYVAYSTGLTNLFPVWSRDGGTDAFLARLDDPATDPRIRREVLAKVDLIGGWNNAMVTSVRDPADRAIEGKRLGDAAGAAGADPYAFTVALLKRNRGNVGMVGFAMSEDNLERILAHPLGMVCSDGGAFAVDGPARRGSPHPRGLGTFARVLGRYVRERKALTLEQAIHKMTGQPATRVGMMSRGWLKVAQAADVVVFDPSTVSDHATYDQPFQYATGVSLVLVNGTVALAGGERRGVGAGKAIRPDRLSH